MKKFIFLMIFGILIISLVTLGTSKTVFPKGRLIITQNHRSLEIPIEIADREELHTLGLMYRKDIPWEYGMLFIFSTDVSYGFWMKNTYVPLDIAFISSDKIIFNIQRMLPCKEGKDCAVYYSPKPYRYALEVKAGFFEKYKFSVGAKIDYIRE
uniref:DUF192 domain-containing protein n=1 Tax=Dictyoglomus thermophilum TaxID=14 RepID=A0A7C3RLL3_DICTH